MAEFTHDGIVILGHPRSGTTLLRRLLNGHPNISCPGETHILSACARFLHSEETASGVDMGVLSGLSFAGFDEKDVIVDLRELALKYLSGYANRKGTRRWAEKTAVDSFFLPEIDKLFGRHAYFVGIIRHGLDVAVSCKDFTEATGVYLENFHPYVRQYLQPLEAFATSWRDVNEQMLEFSSRNPDNCILVRYEDLVEAPEEILESVLEFVGEDYNPGLVADGLGNFEDLGLSDHQTFKESDVTKSRKERWADVPPAQIKRLSATINPLLEKLGYDILETDFDQTLDDARRRYEIGLMVNAKTPDS